MTTPRWFEAASRRFGPGTLGRRASIWMLLSLAAVYLLYIASVYAVLQFGGLKAATQSFDDLSIETQGGFSLWPGIVHAGHLDLRVKDHLVEVQVEARKVRVEFDLSDLLAGQLHIKRTRLRGGAVRVVHRVKKEEPNAQRLAAFPDIFPRSHVYEGPGPESKPLPEILLSNIDAHLDEVWLMEYRVTGKIRASGGTRITPKLHVFDAEVHVADGIAHVGDDALVQTPTCDAEAEIGPVHLSSSTTVDIVAAISGTVKCQVEVSTEVLALYLPDTKISSAGKGNVDLDARIKNGRLVNTLAEMRSTAMKVTASERVWSGESKVKFRANDEGNLVIDVQLDGAQDIEIEKGVLITRSLTARIALGHENIARPKLELLKSRAQGITIVDPRFLADVTQAPSVPWVQMQDLDAHFEYRPADPARMLEAGIDGGKLTLNLQSGSAFGSSVQGKVRCSRSKDNYSCNEARVEASAGRFVDEEGATADFAVRVDTREFKARQPDDWQGSFSVSGSSPKPLLARLGKTDLWKKVGLGVAPLGPFSMQLKLRAAPGPLRVFGRISHMTSGALKGEGAFRFEDTFHSRWVMHTPLTDVAIKQGPEGLAIDPGNDEGSLDAMFAGDR